MNTKLVITPKHTLKDVTPIGIDINCHVMYEVGTDPIYKEILTDKDDSMFDFSLYFEAIALPQGNDTNS